MVRYLICFAGCVLLSALFGVDVFAQEGGEMDIIKQQGGKVLDGGVITEETYEDITYKRSGGLTMKVGWADVTEIEYGGKPEILRSAETTFGAGDYEKAMQGFEAVVRDCKNEKIRKVFLQHALIGLARCQAMVANGTDKAEKTYSELIGMNKSRFLKEAYTECVDMLIRAGAQNKAYFKRADDMIKTARDMVEKAKDFPAKDEVLQKFVFYSAKILEANGDYQNAKDKYQKMKLEIKNMPNPNPVALADATLGIARCAIELKELSDGEEKLNNFIDKEAPSPEENYPVIMAEAWNLLGTIYYKKSEDEKDMNTKKNLLKTSLENFLHGVVQFVPREEDVPVEYAKALYYSSDCYMKLADMIKESNPESSDKYKERARTNLTKIINEVKMPGWMKPAEDLLKKIK